jgi:hypothetical protein
LKKDIFRSYHSKNLPLRFSKVGRYIVWDGSRVYFKKNHGKFKLKMKKIK